MVRTIGYSASGSSSGPHDAAGTSLPRPVGVGNAVAEDDVVARLVGRRGGIGDGALALSRSQVMFAKRRHHARHLGEDVARMGVVPVEPHAAGELLDDPPVLPRLARRRQRLAAELHVAVGVGEGAGLLGPGRGRQDHVGVVGRLGQEDVLDHQMLELGQRLARVMRVGVGHRRVLAHDVHAPDLAGVDRRP